MKTKAALAVEAGKPLEIVNVNLEGPRDGEVLVEIGDKKLGHDALSGEFRLRLLISRSTTPSNWPD